MTAMAPLLWLLLPVVLVVSVLVAPCAGLALVFVPASWGMELCRGGEMPSRRNRAEAFFAAIMLVFLLGHYRLILDRSLELTRCMVGMLLIALGYRVAKRFCWEPAIAAAVACLTVVDHHHQAAAVGMTDILFESSSSALLVLHYVLLSTPSRTPARRRAAAVCGSAALAATLLGGAFVSGFHYFAQWREEGVTTSSFLTTARAASKPELQSGSLTMMGGAERLGGLK